MSESDDRDLVYMLGELYAENRRLRQTITDLMRAMEAAKQREEDSNGRGEAKRSDESDIERQLQHD